MSIALNEERPSAGIAGPFGKAEGINFDSDDTADRDGTGELRSVALDEIIVANRYRKDLGNVRDLAASIADIGLINPITLTPNYELLAGGRRLEAHRMLGLAEVPARIVYTIADARDRLVAERDENTKRKPMLPSESAALGMAIEEIERPAAAARQAASNKQAADARWGNASGSRDPDASGPRRSRDIAAEAIGMPEPTYRRIKTVLAVANDETADEELRAEARDAIAQIDAGAGVRPQSERIKQKREELRKSGEVIPIRTGATTVRWEGMADRHPTARQAYEAEGKQYSNLDAFSSMAQRNGVKFRFTEPTYKTYTNKQSDMLDRTSLSLEVAMQTLEDIDLTVVPQEQLAEALERVSDAPVLLSMFIKKLKEAINV